MGLDMYLFRGKQEIGYWRKANQVHNWFVNKVQGGRDECQESPVTKEQLEELRDICQKILASPANAPSLLPTQSGFFFGNTAYDNWYFEDIKSTVDIVNKVLEGYDGSEPITYVASW